MKNTLWLVVLFLLVGSSITFAADGDLGAANGADGSESSPWLIEDFADFQAFCDDTTKWEEGVCTRLEADIDLDPELPGRVVYDNAPIAGQVYSSYYFKGTPFAGNFDGNDHVISNLSIEGNNYCGLFGKIESGSKISNLGIENADITAYSRYLGGLCGYNNEGTISNCYSTGSIYGLISGSRFIGGLCGYSNYGTISYCYASGTVAGGKTVGGLCGCNNTARISYCYATSKVTGDEIVGGLCGAISYGGITNCFWDIQASGCLTSAGGRGLTTTEMMDPSIFSYNGWAGDIWVLDAGNDYPHLSWENTIGSLMPEPTVNLAGSGTEEAPWIIATADDLQLVASGTFFWDKHYRLAADIDLSEMTYSTGLIGYDIDNNFAGVFDGNKFVISNLTIEGNSNLGLFSFLGKDGIITNLGLENIYISGTDSIIGGLCGYNYDGTITNCYSTGSVLGSENSTAIGGLCGKNYGTISKCYSTSSVSGNDFLGGLCGINYDIIINCYSTGSVSGDKNCRYVGGLCGINRLDLINCFSTGIVTGSSDIGGILGDTVGMYGGCYYYVLAGPIQSIGYPLNDYQLQEKSYFEEFDFLGDDSDGIDDIWAIEPGYMPKLAWQDDDGIKAPSQVDNITTTLTGSGTQEDPFIIADKDDLLEFRNNSSLRTGYYSLTIDIDLAGTVYSEAFIPGVFAGHFDGGNQTISNLSITGQDKLGFFSSLAGQISNLKIINSEIVVSGNYAGVVCADIYYGKITNCFTSGSITGTSSAYLGGLCSQNVYGDVDNCYSTCLVTGDSYLGGLCGYNSSDITNSYATGAVSGNNYLGGLCGKNYDTISYCYATGRVSGGDYIGGLCGYNSQDISNCYATGKVSGNDDIGGLCGINYDTISYCYATGKVLGRSYLGGLCGRDIRYIKKSFWNTKTSGIADPERDLEDTDGMIGLTTAEMQNINTYLIAGWDIINETENGTNDIWEIFPFHYPFFAWQNFEPPIVPDIQNLNLAEAELSIVNAKLSVGEITYSLESSIEKGYIISQYPLANSIAAEDTPVNITISLGEGLNGSGTEATPYLIRNFEDFKIFADPLYGEFYWAEGVYTRLEADIDLDPELPGRVVYDKAPIGGQKYSGFYFNGVPFVGYFDGNNHTISNLSIEGSNYCGLFGKIELGSKITNLYIENVIINDSGHDVGGLCGFNSGTISNCYSTGNIGANIRDSHYIGGLCGNNYYGTISNCYSTSSVSGYSNIGGLCGHNYGTIHNCHSNGSVKGDYTLGGLCGSTGGSRITDSFSSCSITGNNGLGGLCGYNESGLISNCYSTGLILSNDGSATIGGLCGNNLYGTIFNCYSTSNIFGYRFLGGLCGRNSGRILNCYSTGVVLGDGYLGGLCGENFGIITKACFWDTETSGISDREEGGEDTDGIQGLSTAEMQTQSNFIDAGWDFVGEDTNGSDDIWRMPYASPGYPILSWQKDIPGDIAGGYGVDMADAAAVADKWLDSCTMTDLQRMAEYWLAGK